jgi:cobalt/nickel transport system permease protein
MHIPDGYLSPQTYIPLYGASAIFWVIGVKKLKKELSAKEVPYLAMAAAFSFIIQMLIYRSLAAAQGTPSEGR